MGEVCIAVVTIKLGHVALQAVGEDVEKLEVSCMAKRNVNGAAAVETVWQFL